MNVTTIFRPLTAAEFQEMAEKGLFAPHVHLELIDGRIEEMSPVGHKHAAIVNRISEYFFFALGKQYSYSSQNPLVLLNDTQPQPDFMILRRDEDFYENALPTAEDVLLVVEVSDTTLDKDLTVKLPRYATAKIPEVWIINVNDGTIYQFHTLEDATPSYRHRQNYSRGDEILTTLGIKVLVKDVLG